MRLAILCAVSVFALAACAESDPAPPPRDESVPTDIAGEEVEMPAFEPIGGDGSQDAEGTAGTDKELGSDEVMRGKWFAKTMAGDPAVLFGAPETAASFSVRCNAGDLVFSRSTMEPAGAVALTVMAGGETRSLDARSSPDPLPAVTGRLSAQDDFAGILAETEMPIAVRIAGGKSFRMPASAELRKLVDDCRI